MTAEKANAALRERVAAAIALHRSGRLEEAERVYLEVLEASEDNVEALHYLGVLRFQQGRHALAIDLVLRAIELSPGYVDAYNNLGNIFLKLSPADAVKAYQGALDVRPDHPDALRNMGIARRRLELYEEEAEAHLRAIEARPGEVENYYALASTYRNLARYDEAIATFRKALAAKPEADGFFRLGELLHRLRRTDEAVQNYEAWLRAEPGNPIASHMLAAQKLTDVPARAGDAFVATMFDSFATTFDEVLQRIEYRAPALVGEALQRIEGEARGELAILDAGCGTGLLAQHLRPYARRLVGVDLSQKMLEKAATRARYDELVATELTWYLWSSPRAFDIVASSDTLVYFGDLREVLAAAGASLRPGGKLLVTLEHATNEDEIPAGYRIQPHGRYSHTEPYVRKMLGEAGFGAVEVEQAPLRREGAAYVAGLVVTARLANRTEDSIRGRPDRSIRENLERAVELHRQGQLHLAEVAYLAVLRADESNPEALHGLGVLRYQQGWSLSALNLVSRAAEAKPAYFDAYMSLGRIHRDLGYVSAAAQAYGKALELVPDDANAAQDLAGVQDELKRLEESAEVHRRAFEQDPGNAGHLLGLAAAYRKLGRSEEEIGTLRRALAVSPDPAAFARLGTLLHGIGRLDEAAANYEAWLRAEPENPVATHMLAACTGREIPERAADAFVTRAFDRFADSFDDVLRRLEYCAPALVARALLRVAGEPRGALDVMDAGCGTGLLAQHLRPYARRLIGVDLSPKMLEKAAKRAMYDELVAAELTSYLGASPRAFDIVASSDTLVYFGDLRAVLAAASASLRPGGRLVFTLERANEDEVPAGYRINPDGRYMHTQQYVRGVLEQAGFESIGIEKGYLRREGNAYVEGLVVAARAAGGAGSDASSSRNP